MSIIGLRENASVRARRWMRFSARAIALLWAAWWVWFGIASGLNEELSAADLGVHAAVPGLFFLVLALIPWKWEGAGGALLLLEAVIVGVGFPVTGWGRLAPSTLLYVVLSMAVPPLVAGALFLTVWRQSARGRG